MNNIFIFTIFSLNTHGSHALSWGTFKHLTFHSSKVQWRVERLSIYLILEIPRLCTNSQSNNEQDGDLGSNGDLCQRAGCFAKLLIRLLGASSCKLIFSLFCKTLSQLTLATMSERCCMGNHQQVSVAPSLEAGSLRAGFSRGWILMVCVPCLFWYWGQSRRREGEGE